MADYTIRNLREVEDSAPKFGFAPDMQARFAARELGLTESGVSLQRLAPDVDQPFGHRHKRQEELYVVVDGSGRAKLGDEVVELRRWDAVRVAPHVSRAFAAGPDGLEFLAFGAPAVESLPEDVEQEPSPWGEPPGD
jgi:mannose-6-phosphate isomerase-like protein (cupin superfamily)